MDTITHAVSVDDYDEREMFSPMFPLVAAYPTSETIAAVMPQHRLAVRHGGHALRRRTPAPWSAENIVTVPIPDELQAMHALEVTDVLASPPARTLYAKASTPFEAYREAQLSMRGRIDPSRWATAVAHTDERGMILLAEHAHDWAPWAPMIRLAIVLRDSDDSPVLRAAEHRLRLIARRLLDAQGLGDVRVDDTLGHAAMQEAMAAFLTQ